MRLRRAALAALLLLAAAVAPTQPLTSIGLAALRVSGGEHLAAEHRDPGAWFQSLQKRWAEGYSGWVALGDARGKREPGAALAEVEVTVTAEGFRTRIGLSVQGSRRLESRAAIPGHQSSALVETLAGDLFFLWAQAGGFALEPSRPAPRLTALLALDSLRLLPGWRPESSEPLDCAALPEGPVLLFSDRLLSLDTRLDAGSAAARDLFLRPALPQGYRPDRLWLTPLGEPLLYSAATGETLVYPPGAVAERRQTGVRQPVHAAALPRGGLALLAGGRVTLSFVRAGVPLRESLPLPVGFYGAVEGGADGNLWLLDLVEKRVRILSPKGAELGSLKPALDPARLPFPQVFLPLPDGSLLLGGSGELWRFDRFGAPLWRLNRVFTGVSEELPAFFRVAAAGGALYLLDPVGRRLYRFAEVGTEEPDELAGLLGRVQGGGAGLGELVQFALDRGLYLLAQSFFRGDLPEASASETERLAALQKARLARSLKELAGRCEASLELPEAEAALREAARLLGELRARDPVEPAYARDLTEVAERRARLREELLIPADESLAAALGSSQAGPQVLLTLRNASSQAAEKVSVQARWVGFPDGAVVEWSEPMRAGYTVSLPLSGPRLPALEAAGEDLAMSLAVLVSWERGGKREQRYLRAAFTRSPDGRYRPYP